MLLNCSKLKNRLSQITELDEETIELFVNKVQEFFSILENDIETANPNELLELLSVLSTFNELFDEESKWEELIYRLLKKTNLNLQRLAYHPIYAYSGIGQVALILNQIYSKRSDIKQLLFNVNELLCLNLNNYINLVDTSEFSDANTFEFIYGISGSLRHILDFANEKNMLDISVKIVELLITRSQDKNMNGYKVSGWCYLPSIKELKNLPNSAQNGVLNYSLSHGIGGPLVALSLAYKGGININGLRQTIDGLLDEYLHSFYYINDIIYWPGIITLEQYVGQLEVQKKQREMSWCYGSIGILRAIYLSSVCISDKEHELFAIREMEKIAGLRLRDFRLISPIVCHGFASVVSIMTEMYNDTGNVAFINMAQEQMYRCIDYINSVDLQSIEKRSDGKVKKYCYLEGVSGILQTIYSVLFCEESAHKKRILIV